MQFNFLSPCKLTGVKFLKIVASFLIIFSLMATVSYQNNIIGLPVYLISLTIKSEFIFSMGNYKYSDIYIHSRHPGSLTQNCVAVFIALS